MDGMPVLFTLTWAVERFGPPGISYTDQGSQFTTLDWIAMVEDLGIRMKCSTGIAKWRKRPHEKNNQLIHSIHKERRKKPLMPTPYIPAKGFLDEYNIVSQLSIAGVLPSGKIFTSFLLFKINLIATRYQPPIIVGTMERRTPAATAEPITPATLGPMACMRR